MADLAQLQALQQEVAHLKQIKSGANMLIKEAQEFISNLQDTKLLEDALQNA